MTGPTGTAAMIAAQGPIGALTAAIGADSPLGRVDTWSPSLVSTVRLLLSSRAQIVLFWGPELCALYNEAYAATIGDKHPRVLGRPSREGWAELWEDLGPLLESVLTSGETVHAKDRPFYIERDSGRGEEVFFDISYSPVFNADGSVGGVLCIVNETTQRVLAERAMLAERNRLWALARDPFLIADRTGTWLAASPAWTDILGWSQEELVGRTSQWMEHPDDAEQSRAQIHMLAPGQPVTAYENRFRAKDGSYHAFSWTAVMEGETIYCVARDVTEDRARAQALAEAEAALRQAQRMETLGQLTGGVAHDFNNLLQIVTGNLDLMRRALPDDADRLRGMVDRAMAGAERAALLTQRLLAFARRQPLSPRPVCPDQLLSGMAELLARTLGERIDIRTVEAGHRWAIEVDPGQMENALINLAVNARDAMPDGGTLTLEVSSAGVDGTIPLPNTDMAAGDYVVFTVTDTGHGMDEATLARAIEPFFTTKEVGRGTGLGLSMVYGFVKQSGGHLRVVSKPGKGTSVHLYLPRYVGGVAANEDDVEKDGQATIVGGRETILLCEDDAHVRAYSVEVLRDLGYLVIPAADGPAALDALKTADGPVDLLFTDVVLPGGMTGADVARAALVHQPDLKILFTTGFARSALDAQGRLDPGVELLPKPFTYADLASKVRAILHRDDIAPPQVVEPGA